MPSKFITKVKEIVRKMISPKTVTDALKIKNEVSSLMFAQINLWSKMYENRAPWLREPDKESPVRIVSLGLPSLIASEKARMATLEMEVEISAPMKEVEKPNPNYVPPGTDENGFATMGQGSMTITENVPIGSTERADYLAKQFEPVLDNIRRELEYGIACGGLVIKPFPVFDDQFEFSSETDENATDDKTIKKNKTSVPVSTPASDSDMSDSDVEDEEEKDYHAKLEVEYIKAGDFYPLSFDSTGKILEAAFVQRMVDKDVIYTRVEYHKLEGRTCTIINKAYKSNAGAFRIDSRGDDMLGKEVPLSEISAWAGLRAETTIKGVDRLLFAYFKMPEANIVDPYSPLGVSGYSKVVSLIKDADMQYSRTLWEFEGGELAIDVDRDALKLTQDNEGHDTTVRPVAQERLFRKIDLNSEETYEVFSPALRDVSLLNGLNAILTRIEDAVGFSRGTISNTPLNEAKTATEIKILKQRSYSTNADIQHALEKALKDVVYVMNVYCDLYKITPKGKYECSFEWDDSILVDMETELSKRLTLMQNGLASKLETRMWYFHETENQAKAALQEIDDEAKKAIETNMMAQSQMGEEAQNQAPGTFKKENLSNPLTGVKATNEQKAKNMPKPEK